MNACEERLLACDLEELLGGKQAPDLIAITLRRVAQGKAGAEPRAETPVLRLPARRYLRLVEAACILAALGLAAWLAWPRSLPKEVHATANAGYSVRGEYIELNAGALLLETGAPEVRVGLARVSRVNGRVVLHPGSIPDISLLEGLPFSEKEKPMLKDMKRWTLATGVALCVLSGSVMLNETQLFAGEKDAAPEETQKPLPNPEDTEGLRALLEKTVRINIRARDENYAMCIPVEVSDRTQVKELVDPIYSHQGLAEAPAGWDSDNEITFHTRDGEKIEILVNIKAGLADIRLRGWKRFYEYNARTDLLKRFEPWFKASTAKGPDCPSAPGLRKLRGWHGAHSNVLTPERTFIEDQATWARTWSRHSTDANPPEVDFTREVVLAIFQGRGGNSRGVYLHEILEDQSSSGEFIVRFDEYSYQTMGGGDDTTAFGIFVLTRTSAPVRLEENIQGLIRSLPLWRRHDAALNPRAVVERSAPAVVARLRGWEGENSDIAGKGAYLIENKAAMKELWEKHAPKESVPEVDFEKEVVVAIFQRVPSGWGGVKVELFASEATARIQIRRDTWQEAGGPDVPKVGITTAYGIHVFPRTGHKLILELPAGDFDLKVPNRQETAWGSR